MTKSSLSFVRRDMLAPQSAPVTERGAVKWLRENLFSSIGNSVLTILGLLVLFWIVQASLPWLLIGVIGGLMGAKIIGFFEVGLSKYIALASFIPLVAATGGNVGIQSSSLVVQSLASKSVFDDTPWQRFIKGLLIALVNGVVLATFVFLVVVFIYGFESIFGFTIGLAMFCVVLLSSFMGTVTPLVLDRFGINPAIASGPFITTANDLIGIGTYFLIAYYLLRLN